MPAKTWAMSPATRMWLSAMQPGDKSVYEQLPDGVGYRACERAVLEGYVTKKPQGRSPWVRTNKAVKPYKPRGPRARRDGEPYPWGVKEHWRRITQSPIRMAYDVSMNLRDSCSRWDSLALCMRYPKGSNTITQLAEYRKFLYTIFTKGVHGWEQSWWPTGLLEWCYIPEQLHLLLMLMVVRPTFDNQGQFEQFDPVDPDVAAAEVYRLTHDTPEPTERYQLYMRSASYGLPSG